MNWKKYEEKISGNVKWIIRGNALTITFSTKIKSFILRNNTLLYHVENPEEIESLHLVNSAYTLDENEVQWLIRKLRNFPNIHKVSFYELFKPILFSFFLKQLRKTSTNLQILTLYKINIRLVARPDLKQITKLFENEFQDIEVKILDLFLHQDFLQVVSSSCLELCSRLCSFCGKNDSCTNLLASYRKTLNIYPFKNIKTLLSTKTGESKVSLES
eukprot:snap_masked-scaffold_6-processed-gene-8.18-mRNA-1 protein AED:1.00 eAED:1.00 QI:0/0/0/0/1/1/2/0/215